MIKNNLSNQLTELISIIIQIIWNLKIQSVTKYTIVIIIMEDGMYV